MRQHVPAPLSPPPAVALLIANVLPLPATNLAGRKGPKASEWSKRPRGLRVLAVLAQRVDVGPAITAGEAPVLDGQHLAVVGERHA